MKNVIFTLAMVALSACGHNSGQASTVQSASSGRVMRPAQAVVLNGRQAETLISKFKSAGVPALEAIESTTWTLNKIECSQFFIAGSGLQSNCELALPSDEASSQGPVTRPDMSITINGKAAKSLIVILKNQVGVQPVSAIESTTWTTGSVECSQSFLAGHGLVSECNVTL